jgi:hypothetical protein
VSNQKITMRILLSVAVALSAASTVLCQKQARIGPDGKPLLNRPLMEECQKRISHMQWGGHNYFLSWREPWHKFEDWDWFNGRNFCRDRCMDLVSFETPGEYRLFSAIARQDNVSSIYTSGRKCNFKGKGCDAEHLQPINVNGWFWAGAGNARIPKTDLRGSDAYWSLTGETGAPQPDNFEGIREGPIDTEFDIGVTIEGLQEFHDEACLAVMNNKYNDGIKWHDVACHFRSVIVCEDSDQLIALVQQQNGVDVTGTVKKGEDSRLVDPDTAIAEEERYEAQQAALAAQHQRPRRPPQGFGHQFGFGGGPQKQRPARRPHQTLGGFLGGFKFRPFRF